MSYDLTSYSGLKTSIANLLNRADLTDYIDGFIDMFEADINNELSVLNMHETVTLTPSSGEITLPSDFRSVVSMVALTNPRRVLTQTTAEAIDLRYGDRDSGDPAYYAVTGSKALIMPTTTSNISLTYVKGVPALSDDNTSNWLLVQAPQLYLYGAAVHSAPLLMDDQRVALWGNLYENFIGKLRERSRRARFGRLVSRLASPTP